MRIVGGTLRGRALVTPADRSVRPTADRVRESVFNILEHGIAATRIAGARVIDLFAGTGALGIECLSRGAAYCLFVEDSAEARGVIRQNVEAFGLTGVSKIYRRDATNLGPAGHIGSFDLALLDPPYSQGLGDKALACLVAGGWLAPNATVVLEERSGVAVALPADLTELDRRSYGETQVLFARWGATAAAP